MLSLSAGDGQNAVAQLHPIDKLELCRQEKSGIWMWSNIGSQVGCPIARVAAIPLGGGGELFGYCARRPDAPGWLSLNG